MFPVKLDIDWMDLYRFVLINWSDILAGHRHVMRGRTRDGQAAAVSNEEWSFDTFDPCCNKFFKSKRLGGPGSWVKLAKSCLKGCEKLWMNCALYLTTSVFQEC